MSPRLKPTASDATTTAAGPKTANSYLEAHPRKTRLTMPLLSIAHKDRLAIEITHEMYDAPMPALARNQEGTVPVVPVIDLSTEEAALLIVPAVFRSVLQNDREYVGKRYELVRGEAREGKNYREVEVWEID